MRRIAAEIRAETGLTCSVGISESRMLAKITSELGKPAGLVVLSREEALERFADDSPASSPGSARRRSPGWRGWGSARWPTCAAGSARRSKTASARARAPGCTPAAASSTRRRSRPNTRPSRSRPRPPSTSTSRRAELERHLAELAEELCRRLRKRELAAARSGSRSGSTTGPTSPAPTPSRSRPTTRRVVGRSPSTCCAPTTRRGRCACSASASPPSRRRSGGRDGADTRSAPARR